MGHIARIVFIFTGLALLTGCYRMPTEDDYSLVPTINNPSVTREKGTGFMPAADY